MTNETRTRIVKVQLSNGYDLNAEAGQTKGQEDIAASEKRIKPDEIIKAVEATAQVLREALERIDPDKASVKFSLRLAIEHGELIVLIAKGSEQSNFEVTLEWSK